MYGIKMYEKVGKALKKYVWHILLCTLSSAAAFCLADWHNALSLIFVTNKLVLWYKPGVVRKHNQIAF